MYYQHCLNEYLSSAIQNSGVCYGESRDSQFHPVAAYLAPANIRFNALAPGFFLNERSKKLLKKSDGEYSDRGKNILHHTPMDRFGQPSELIGCMKWLIDDEASGFVTGITIPIDGGFLSCSGV